MWREARRGYPKSIGDTRTPSGMGLALKMGMGTGIPELFGFGESKIRPRPAPLPCLRKGIGSKCKSIGCKVELRPGTGVWVGLFFLTINAQLKSMYSKSNRTSRFNRSSREPGTYTVRLTRKTAKHKNRI
jgi:hypothetical protein